MAGFFADVKADTLLLFFILLVLIFLSCPLFRDCGSELLFFFLILAYIFCGCGRV